MDVQTEAESVLREIGLNVSSWVTFGTPYKVIGEGSFPVILDFSVPGITEQDVIEEHLVSSAPVLRGLKRERFPTQSRVGGRSRGQGRTSSTSDRLLCTK